MISFPLPLVGFAAYSGTGKTTLLCKVIPLLTQKGIRVGVIKHAHHRFDIDQPEKDSFQLRESGASKIVVSSRHRTAIIIENPDNQIEPTLEVALQDFPIKDLDLILVEGFKLAGILKIELHRQALAKPYIHTNDKNIIAIATDYEFKSNGNIPYRLDLNQPQQIADFIESHIVRGNSYL